MSPLFVLASASPARRAILIQAGIDPFVAVSNFDEDQITTTDPIELVQILAKSKAEAVQSRFQDQEALILGCDSVMVVDGEIFGKPIYKERAIAMWEKMRGNQGELYTGHCLIDIKNHRTLTRYGITTVGFANATDAEIESYIDTGEPLNCAGCCTLEGLGGFLIEGLEGCHTNVLGLSLPLLREMLQALGYSLKFAGHKVEINPQSF
ncbi:MAF protein [Synechococcus sp. PCC 7502]|uniref:Maf family protein n=1 Tax=Synechococcus sp. PCC 7502 TaxID=1173263 RepID=UPI00029F9754|nr:nucleoside triphosphate pyrophosphatase [Synechococcus sp. PCC 7502]AFY73325.1 MAF protein [Synechococcus sp. PCC 7502]